MNDCLHVAVITTNITAEIACHRCDDCRTSWWEEDGRKVPLAQALDKLKAAVEAPPAEDLLSTAAVAAMLHVTQRSVANWVAWGRLSAVRTPGGHLRIPRAEVLELRPRRRSG